MAQSRALGHRRRSPGYTRENIISGSTFDLTTCFAACMEEQHKAEMVNLTVARFTGSGLGTMKSYRWPLVDGDTQILEIVAGWRRDRMHLPSRTVLFLLQGTAVVCLLSGYC